MGKDWRLAVCTRWRPLVGAILVCLSLLCTGIVVYFAYTTVDEYPERRLESRIQKIKVGISITELEGILGPPDAKNDNVDRESLSLVEGGSDKIVEYCYSAESRSGEHWVEYKGVFVDENTGRIVALRFSRGWSLMLDSTVWGEWGFYLAIGLMILVALLVMLFFRTWCRSVTDADEDSGRSNDAQEAQEAQPRR